MFQNVFAVTIYTDATPLPLPALAGCGAMSGAFTSLILTPIELVKCQMQVPVDAGRNTRRSIPSVIASVWRHRGLIGFWRGQTGTLVRETGGSAAWFGSYESVSAYFRSRQDKISSSQSVAVAGEKFDLPVWQQMLAGAAAGMCYNFAFYPADTIKSRLQTEEVVGKKVMRARKTFWGTGKAVWRQHGLKGLYRGCGITVARSAPSSALIFTIYEALKSRF